MLLIWCNIDICRLLIFPPSHTLTVDLYIDKVKIGEAQNVKGPLYVLPWKPEQFKSGLHHITAVVKVQIMYCRNLNVVIHVPYGGFLEISLLLLDIYIEKNCRYIFIGCNILVLVPVIHYNKNFIKILVFISKVQKHMFYTSLFPVVHHSLQALFLHVPVYLLMAMKYDVNTWDEIFWLSWLQTPVNVCLMLSTYVSGKWVHHQREISVILPGWNHWTISNSGTYCAHGGLAFYCKYRN